MEQLPDDIAIKVTDLRKTYHLGELNRSSFRDEIIYRWNTLLGRDPRKVLGKIGTNSTCGLFHALDGVSFDVKRGETVGLIGRNGAGKSTALKILSRITEPTAGKAVMRGRVGSLLEVGTGFHPDLTGRENIFLNGMILGMHKSEIEAKFDEIVDFAEVGPFLDTPVKRYSSGMFVKLAFSVASSLDTDILLVDEVLAVGDADFQKKSLARMKSIAASGRTVVFVSHNMDSVRTICSRCLFFVNGKLAMDGDVDSVIRAYQTPAGNADGALQG